MSTQIYFELCYDNKFISNNLNKIIRTNLTRSFLFLNVIFNPQINPQHTLPTLSDDGHIVWESNAINIYLIEKYAKDDSLYPKDPAKRSTINQRLFFNSGVLFPSFRTCTAPILFGMQSEPQLQHIEGIKNALALFNAQFLGNTFLAGESITLADYSAITTITQLTTYVDIDDEMYPHINPWIKRVENEIEDFDELNTKFVDMFKELVKNKMKLNSAK